MTTITDYFCYTETETSFPNEISFPNEEMDNRVPITMKTNNSVFLPI